MRIILPVAGLATVALVALWPRIQTALNHPTQPTEQDRRARYVCVICLGAPGAPVSKVFVGESAGRIGRELRGSNGFGYDAVFVPDGSEKTFAEMELAEKNGYSHRKKAADKLVSFLQTAS